MGHIDVSAVEYSLSDGRVLLNDVSFRVGDGAKVALIGPNGSGKTTLVRMICGDISPDEGSVAITGGLGVMRQFIGSVRDETTVREILISVAPPRIRDAAAKIIATEKARWPMRNQLSSGAIAVDMNSKLFGISAAQRCLGRLLMRLQIAK